MFLMQNVHFRSYGTPDLKKVPGTILNNLVDFHYEILYKGKRIMWHIEQIRRNVGLTQRNGHRRHSQI